MKTNYLVKAATRKNLESKNPGTDKSSDFLPGFLVSRFHRLVLVLKDEEEEVKQGQHENQLPCQGSNKKEFGIQESRNRQEFRFPSWFPGFQISSACACSRTRKRKSNKDNVKTNYLVKAVTRKNLDDQATAN